MDLIHQHQLKVNWMHYVKSLSSLFIVIIFSASVFAGDIYVGTATADITPKLPVALMGQFHLRIATEAETPLLANIIAVESRDGNNSDYSIFVACDLVIISDQLLIQARETIKKRLPAVDVNKIIITATHTHTCPVTDTVLMNYPIPKEGVSQIQDYLDLFAARVSDAVVKAWENRKPGIVTWGLSHAVVGYNRRSVYADGRAVMYGATEIPEFRGMEGPEDHDVNILFFWNKMGKLIGTTVTVPCPSQEVENRNAINADYWHDVRLDLKKRFGNDLVVVGWCGAAGDQSPHVRYRQRGDERMHKLANRTRTQEIARRIGVAVQEAYDVVKTDRYDNLPVVHKYEKLQLPMRAVTEAERLDAVRNRDRAAAAIAADPSKVNELQGEKNWYGSTVALAEKQKANPALFHPTEIHAIRIGDIVICTNPFELFVDYSIQMQARSKAVQTFVVQLAGSGGYLPTQKAKDAGGYSAVVQSTPVGPEGGMILVDKTVDLINSLWP
ncbi:MAG: hypothetical protein J7497_05420 [Chitinophagaceae bacterium]|nr:hypothetical protein [Chitinophagaceae bacterium]